jgi:hypothetical protein
MLGHSFHVLRDGKGDFVVSQFGYFARFGLLFFPSHALLILEFGT